MGHLKGVLYSGLLSLLLCSGLKAEPLVKPNASIVPSNFFSEVVIRYGKDSRDQELSLKLAEDFSALGFRGRVKLQTWKEPLPKTGLVVEIDHNWLGGEAKKIESNITVVRPGLYNILDPALQTHYIGLDKPWGVSSTSNSTFYMMPVLSYFKTLRTDFRDLLSKDFLGAFVGLSGMVESAIYENSRALSTLLLNAAAFTSAFDKKQLKVSLNFENILDPYLKIGLLISAALQGEPEALAKLIELYRKEKLLVSKSTTVFDELPGFLSYNLENSGLKKFLNLSVDSADTDADLIHKAILLFSSRTELRGAVFLAFDIRSYIHYVERYQNLDSVEAMRSLLRNAADIGEGAVFELEVNRLKTRGDVLSFEREFDALVTETIRTRDYNLFMRILAYFDSGLMKEKQLVPIFLKLFEAIPYVPGKGPDSILPDPYREILLNSAFNNAFEKSNAYDGLHYLRPILKMAEKMSFERNSSLFSNIGMEKFSHFFRGLPIAKVSKELNEILELAKSKKNTSLFYGFSNGLATRLKDPDLTSEDLIVGEQLLDTAIQFSKLVGDYQVPDLIGRYLKTKDFADSSWDKLRESIDQPARPLPSLCARVAKRLGLTRLKI